MSNYGYIETSDRYSLCRMVDRRTCWVFSTQTGLSIRKHPVLDVPAAFWASRRAPKVIWKTNAPPELQTAPDMVDLYGAPAELSPADQAFLVFVGGGMIVAAVGTAAVFAAGRSS